MVRSLWTGATGMAAQQLNVDNISNNLANVNTTGYKTEVMEFKSLLYQTIQTKTTSANGDEKPIGAEVGLGTRNASIMSIFTQGNLMESASATNFAIDGAGFFGVLGEDGTTYYTRNGNFLFAEGVDGLTLANSDGLPVLDSNGEPIILEEGMVASKVSVSGRGELSYPGEDGSDVPLGITIGTWQFNNPAGLSKIGGSLFEQTEASGEAMNEFENDNVKKSTVIQGFLEGSNVAIADEMVNLIVAQRAYEMNSKVITTSDEMLQQANQLKR